LEMSVLHIVTTSLSWRLVLLNPVLPDISHFLQTSAENNLEIIYTETKSLRYNTYKSVGGVTLNQFYKISYIPSVCNVKSGNKYYTYRESISV